MLLLALSLYHKFVCYIQGQQSICSKEQEDVTRVVPWQVLKSNRKNDHHKSSTSPIDHNCIADIIWLDCLCHPNPHHWRIRETICQQIKHKCYHYNHLGKCRLALRNKIAVTDQIENCNYSYSTIHSDFFSAIFIDEHNRNCRKHEVKKHKD